MLLSLDFPGERERDCRDLSTSVENHFPRCDVAAHLDACAAYTKLASKYEASITVQHINLNASSRHGRHGGGTDPLQCFDGRRSSLYSYLSSVAYPGVPHGGVRTGGHIPPAKHLKLIGFGPLF